MVLEELSEFLRASSFNRVLALGVLAAGTFLAARLINAVSRTVRGRAFERSRREIAAYVAEGSITPEGAVGLLGVHERGESDSEQQTTDPAKRLAEAVNWMSLSKKDARVLVEARGSMDEASWAKAVDLACEGMPAEDAVKLSRLRSGPAGVAAGAPSRA